MEETKGRIGIAVLLTALLASALVSWAIAAMADDAVTSGSPTAAAAADPGDPQEGSDPTDPENAPEFDGPKHKTHDASIDAPLPGTTHRVNLEVTEDTFEVAEGKFMNLWTFGGSVPGPVIRVTQGDTIHFKLTNKGATTHSMDFHSAEIAPNRAYVAVEPGKSFEFEWEAVQPGVFMYHCATAPVLHHIGNGMYGMVIVEPKGEELAPAREYALVQSELYFGGQDKVGDLTKMMDEDPDWIVFNGYANQYIDDPLPADPGETVRVYILNAGPSKWSAFHVIGTIFDRTWQEGVVGGPAQTVSIAPSQGAIVEFSMEEDGMYPFVTHAFGDAVKGAIGVFMVGDGGPGGTEGH
jgi:nitrite reductase (NO-forming)